MHKTLSVGQNRVLIFVWGVAILVLTLRSGGAVAPSAVVGAILGVPAGLLQRTALRADASAFAKTVTALDVRRVLISSRAGKFAISLGYLCALVLLPIALFAHQSGLAVANWLAGYFAFMFVRDALAYPALRTLGP